MATRKARELKGLEALKRKTSREKEKLTKLLADQLKDDLSGLLCEGTEADISFYLNKDRFHLHRCILNSRYPSFYEVLQIFLKKEEQNVPARVVDSLRTVIRYIYCEEDIKYVSHLVDHLTMFFTSGNLPPESGNDFLSQSIVDEQSHEAGERPGEICAAMTPDSIDEDTEWSGSHAQRYGEDKVAENMLSDVCVQLEEYASSTVDRVKSGHSGDSEQEESKVTEATVMSASHQLGDTEERNSSYRKHETQGTTSSELKELSVVGEKLVATENSVSSKKYKTSDLLENGSSEYKQRDGNSAMESQGIKASLAAETQVSINVGQIMSGNDSADRDINNKEDVDSLSSELIEAASQSFGMAAVTEKELSRLNGDNVFATGSHCKEKEETEGPRLETNTNTGTVSVTEKDRPGRTEEEEVMVERFTEAVSVLGSDLLYMYQEGMDVDVVLLAGEQRFYAHRCILCSRSEYFNAMLQGGWTESMTNEVIIQGLGGDVLEKILLCIYGGFLDTFDLTLVAMGDMYNLRSLKMCMEYALLKDRCHFFHKPCPGCLTGIVESLGVSYTYGLDDLHTDTLHWSTKQYNRLWPTRAFAQLPQEIMAQCEKALVQDIGFNSVVSHALEIEKVMTALRNLKWGEPVIAMAARVMDSCVSFLGRHLNSYVIHRKPNLIDREYRGMHADSIKELLVRATDFLKPEEAIRLFTYLSDKCEQLTALREDRPKGVTDLEFYAEFLKDVLGLVKQYLVRNIRQCISTSEWGQLSAQQQETLKTEAGYVFMGGDSIPKHKKPVLSNKQGMKFTPKKGRIQLGKFGEPLNKPKDVIPKRKPDSYTGYQHVIRSGKSQNNGKESKDSKMKVKLEGKSKVQKSSCREEKEHQRQTVNIMTGSKQCEELDQTKYMASHMVKQRSSTGDSAVLQNESALQSANNFSGLFMESETESNIENKMETHSETDGVNSFTFTDNFCTTLDFLFVKPE